MVKTTNDITQKNYKKLSIRVSLNGLSFCVFNLLTQKIIALQEVHFQENQVLEEQLWKVFANYPVLAEKYDEIKVVHNNSLNTFVPQTLFDENFLGSYLQYNVKVFDTDLFAFDKLKNTDANNVFVPYVNVNNFLLDQFQSFEYQHSNTVLVDTLLEQTPYSFEKQVFVHNQKNQFEVVVIQEKKLVFFNSFLPSTTEDFIYYLLFTFEQLQLNPNSCKTEFLGNISTEDAFFKMAYKYIRNCSILNIEKLAENYTITPNEALKHFILLHI